MSSRWIIVPTARLESNFGVYSSGCLWALEETQNEEEGEEVGGFQQQTFRGKDCWKKEINWY